MLTNVFKTFMRVRGLNSFYFGESANLQKRQQQAKIAQKIKQALNPSYISVVDISVGAHSCGKMFNFVVQSDMFVGKSKVEQHRMVLSIIQQELKEIHGYNLKTKIPEDPFPQSKEHASQKKE